MWPVVAEASVDGGERPSGSVFGHITPAYHVRFEPAKGIVVQLALTVF
jgi:hypothetical protein